MGGWMDLITIYVSPFGALLVAVCIYFVLGMKDIRAELALGRARAPGRLFGITARFYVFLTVAVWILGIATAASAEFPRKKRPARFGEHR